jgi:hypothetical protein
LQSFTITGLIKLSTRGRIRLGHYLATDTRRINDASKNDNFFNQNLAQESCYAWRKQGSSGWNGQIFTSPHSLINAFPPTVDIVSTGKWTRIGVKWREFSMNQPNEPVHTPVSLKSTQDLLAFSSFTL